MNTLSFERTVIVNKLCREHAYGRSLWPVMAELEDGRVDRVIRYRIHQGDMQVIALNRRPGEDWLPARRVWQAERGDS